ncbi:hypothetical protein SPBR_07225 [Sporothrix brasiliensis 5110]|uniref:Uncharacterized protein n=1 Tax=Sporothrix brasiliensis 5110 TaxID=1398154 RepID=A0A0C2IV27_9PEZI|nr:uncharacterized protein SPBR_07225 [Sporothrix brasiliensis 5110]KIH88862.1 hypothetical protein SPBR_07225 [Sporothrix brasiliensis 5110]
MPSIRKYNSGDSTGSILSSNHESNKGRHSSVIDAVPFSSQSTAPTSMSGSPRLPDSERMPSSPAPLCHDPQEDLSPSTMCYPRASVDTYVSGADSDEELDQQLPESALDLTDDDDVSKDHDWYHGLNRSEDSIPPLPEYRHDIVDRNVCPATPQEFAQLFPSLDRMSVRHDEFTADGNMNLRVDISVPMGRRRILTSYQLFHLRMYDLAKRDFSLRRYSRDSGREVCNSKLTFIDPSEKKHKVGRTSRKSSYDDNMKHWGRSSTTSNTSGGHAKTASTDVRPALQRSMTTALRSLGAMATIPAFRRSNSSGTDYHQQRPATSHSPYGSNHASEYTTSSTQPSLSSSTPSLFGREKSRSVHFPPPPKPTNTIKLEFSNYARVDLELRGGHNNGHDNTRYEFTWWGHKYTWKRAVEKHLNVVSYHLLRDDNGENPIAHIVPEMRSPNQIDADEVAGGWIPPCHMWIADPSVLQVMTDVAE